jgi:hypothetical protein
LIGDASIRRFAVSVAASGELDLDIDTVIKDGLTQFQTRKLEKERQKLTMEIAKASAPGSDKEGSVGLLEMLKTKMTLDKEISRLKGEVDE